MKASEFIKKYGWDKAKELIAKHEKSFMPRVFDMWSDELQDFVLAEKHASFDMDDLKRLVESHELIESCGGLDAAKHELITLQKHLNNTFGWVTVITEEKIDRLKQAILDVESCQ